MLNETTIVIVGSKRTIVVQVKSNSIAVQQIQSSITSWHIVEKVTSLAHLLSKYNTREMGSVEDSTDIGGKQLQ